MIKVLAVDGIGYPQYMFVRVLEGETFTAQDGTQHPGPTRLTVYPTGHVAIAADEEALLRGIHSAQREGYKLVRDVAVQHYWLTETREQVACDDAGNVRTDVLANTYTPEQHDINEVPMQEMGSVYLACDNDEQLLDSYSK